MEQLSYLKDDPGGYEALLTTCNTCMPNKANSCPDCSTEADVTINGEDPDSGSTTWSSEDVSQANNTRSGATDRFPYQIITKGTGGSGAIASLGCSDDCAYLARIKYKLETSSARRSFFQCGFSDIWLVERWSSTTQIEEVFVVATSLPFDYSNAQFASDYSGEPGNKKSGSSAAAADYFNPYGLRERYDPQASTREVHCGTLMFFCKGNDIIKFKLAQHTCLPSAIDINPDNFNMSNGSAATDQDYQHGVYSAQGNFKLKVFTRPIPGKLELSKKSVGEDINTAKYHPYIKSD